jgi:hypothetical protein
MRSIDCTLIKSLRATDLVKIQVSYDGGNLWHDNNAVTALEARMTKIYNGSATIHRAIPG